MKIVTRPFEVALRVRLNLETLTLVLKPQSTPAASLGLAFRIPHLTPFMWLGFGLAQ